MRRLGIALCLFVAAFSASAGALIGNQDIIEMSKLQLGDAVIIAKVESSPGAFDTSTQGLLQLKQAGVSDAVVTAIVKAQASGGTTSAAVAAGLANAEMAVVTTAGSEPLTAVQLAAETSDRKSWIPMYNAPMETFFFFEGANAARTLSDAEPHFRTKLPPDRVKLVHLGFHKGRKTRFVVFSGGSSDRVMSVRVTTLDGGIHEIAPQQPLEAGEYALMIAPDLEADPNTPALMRGMVGFARSRMAIYNKAYDFAVTGSSAAVATSDAK